MSNEGVIEKFRDKLVRDLGIDLELVINENRSTMLNILSKKRNFARVSVHKMFLDAPENVIAAIAHYVRGTRRDRQHKDLIIRGYIQSNLNRFNYSHKLDEKKFATHGKFYDLKQIFDSLNHHYFKDSLDLKITWYGTPGLKIRTKVTFGQYFDHLKLIKIHRLIDDPFFPSYFVRFVVYHEMLHHVVAGKFDSRGFFRVHVPEFKRREKEFAEYEEATLWEKNNRKVFFGSKIV